MSRLAPANIEHYPLLVSVHVCAFEIVERYDAAVYPYALNSKGWTVLTFD